MPTIYHREAWQEHIADNGELIMKGESYFTWSFYGNKINPINGSNFIRCKSRTMPTREKLTLNKYKLKIYEIEDGIIDALSTDEKMIDIYIFHALEILTGLILEQTTFLDRYKEGKGKALGITTSIKTAPGRAKKRLEALKIWFEELVKWREDYRINNKTIPELLEDFKKIKYKDPEPKNIKYVGCNGLDPSLFV